MSNNINTNSPYPADAQKFNVSSNVSKNPKYNPENLRIVDVVLKVLEPLKNYVFEGLRSDYVEINSEGEEEPFPDFSQIESDLEEMVIKKAKKDEEAKVPKPQKFSEEEVRSLLRIVEKAKKQWVDIYPEQLTSSLGELFDESLRKGYAVAFPTEEDNINKPQENVSIKVDKGVSPLVVEENVSIDDIMRDRSRHISRDSEELKYNSFSKQESDIARLSLSSNDSEPEVEFEELPEPVGDELLVTNYFDKLDRLKSLHAELNEQDKKQLERDISEIKRAMTNLISAQNNDDSAESQAAPNKARLALYFITAKTIYKSYFPDKDIDGMLS